ncbi:unnamed protein product [Nesidiocoris tenuis]|uniref:Uncharacterized protein n=1 Tax=Nesidiocoris tenuis TaxID=355587 RepID=A0A6H5HAZ4_9HEMI|nr:unnamed protein product [Nesidiocoris tenuis]
MSGGGGGGEEMVEVEVAVVEEEEEVVVEMLISFRIQATQKNCWRVWGFLELSRWIIMHGAQILLHGA